MVTKRKPQRVYQHEPVVAPAQWKGDERQFALQVEQLFDSLYQKIGTLESRVKALEGSENAQV